MEISWKPQALDHLSQIRDWYILEMGYGAANKFVAGIIKVVEQLEHLPYLGRIEEEISDQSTTYRSVVEHKTYKVIYYIDSDVIYIIAIWSCRQNPRHLSSL